jgi:aminopeptidase N
MQTYWYQLLIVQQGVLSHDDLVFFEKLMIAKPYGVLSLLLKTPSFDTLLLSQDGLNPMSYLKASRNLSRTLAAHLQESLNEILVLDFPAVFEPKAIEGRHLQSVCIRLLAYLDLSSTVFDSYLNKHPMMTSKIAALTALVQAVPRDKKTQEYLNQFYTTYKDNVLLIGQWLKLEAQKSILENEVLPIELHKNFDLRNPNKVYAVVGSFCQNNLENFHHESSSGYHWWAQKIHDLDKLNPQVASKIAKIPKQWSRWEGSFKARFESVLRLLLAESSLSTNTREILEHLVTMG